MFYLYFRSINGGAFKLWQTLSCPHAIKIEYSHVSASHDFLLYAITDSLEKSLIIYQYQGNILGFQEILADTILPKHIKDISPLNLKSVQEYMIAIGYIDKIIVVKTVLSKM